MRTVVDIPDDIRANTVGRSLVVGMPLQHMVEEDRGLAQHHVYDASHNPLESICGADGIGKPPAWTVSLTGSSELKAQNPLA